MNAAAQTEIRDSDRIAFLRLRGSLDDKTVFSFKKSVFNIPPTKKVLVLDLSRLDHVSNVGLGTMIDSFRYFRKRGGRIFLVQAGEELQLLLRHFRATDLCTLVQSYEEVQDHLHMQSSLELSDTPFIESDGVAGSPIVHHHYYGRRSEISRREPIANDELEESDSGTLHVLNQTLARLQQTLSQQSDGVPGAALEKLDRIEKADERIETKLDEIGKGEGRLSERLFNLEKNLSRSFEERLERMEARLIDHIEHRPATALSAKPAASAFLGTRMVECGHCGSVLRVKQSGRHLCPSCQAEFVVDEKGHAKF
jgi:anti-anti-sigma factor